MRCNKKGMTGTYSNYYDKTIYHDCGTTLPNGQQDYCKECEERYNKDKPQLSKLINEESESYNGGCY